MRKINERDMPEENMCHWYKYGIERSKSSKVVIVLAAKERVSPLK